MISLDFELPIAFDRPKPLIVAYSLMAISLGSSIRLCHERTPL